MNKYTLLFAACIVLSFSSCVDTPTDEVTINANDAFRSANSYFIPEEDALKEVSSLLDIMEQPTRSGEKRKIESCKKVGGFGTTRSEGEEESPLYYIVNFENNEGFAVASGDNRTTPVFCITEEGHLDNLDFIDNPEEAEIPGMAIMFSEYDTNYRIAVGLPINTGNGIIAPGDPGYPKPNSAPGGTIIGGWTNPYQDWTIRYTTWAENSRRGNIIAANWGQGEPYNNMMSVQNNNQRQLAGCGPVAVALVMYHWGQPNGNLKYHGANIDWNIIRRHTIENGDPEKNRTCTQAVAHPMIANLFYELHHKKNLQCIYFGQDETATLIDNVPRTMENLGYANGGKTKVYNYEEAAAAIANGRPVIVRGYASMTEGHFWVIDQVLVQYRRQEAYKKGVLQSYTTETRDFVHVNWGWDGDYNGYFYPSCFDSKNSIDVTRTGEDGYFRYNLDMNAGISWTKY